MYNCIHSLFIHHPLLTLCRGEQIKTRYFCEQKCICGYLHKGMLMYAVYNSKHVRQ